MREQHIALNILNAEESEPRLRGISETERNGTKWAWSKTLLLRAAWTLKGIHLIGLPFQVLCRPWQVAAQPSRKASFGPVSPTGSQAKAVRECPLTYLPTLFTYQLNFSLIDSQSPHFELTLARCAWSAHANRSFTNRSIECLLVTFRRYVLLL